MDEEAKLLLEIIRSQEGKEYVQRMFHGISESWRHSLFKTRMSGKQERLSLNSGLGPFSQNLGLKMVTCLDEYLLEIDKSNTISRWGSRKDYLFNVLIPEAIVYAMCRVHDITMEKAEQRFRKLSSETP